MEREESRLVLESPLIPSSENGLQSGLIRLNDGYSRADILVEVKRQMWLAGPLITVGLLQSSLLMISIMFVGHLGELSLSSASMASSFAGVTGFSLMLGMGSALDTLCGQAYGAKQYYMLGIHMQRAMLVVLLLCIPVAFIWAYTGHIFIYLGQESEMSMQAEIYARWLIPSIFSHGLLQCQVKFLQTQNNVFPMMFSTGFTTVLHVLVCWTLVFRYSLGNKGAALANGISYWINVLLLALYIKFSPSCKKTWTGFSKEALHDLFNFLRFAIPSALMVCLEFWSFEFLVLASGFLPNPKLETSMMSTSLNTSSMVFRIPFGLGCAMSTRVSNELGAGHPQAARLAVWIALFIAVAEGMLASFTMVAVRDIWGYLYSNEEEVVIYLAAIMPVLAMSNFMDGIQGVLSGAIRGCGWQKIGALINLGSYYLVGIPSAILLTFVIRIGGKGLWMGITCGSSLQSLLLLTISLTMNWEQEAKKAKDRVYTSKIPTDMAS